MNDSNVVAQLKAFVLILFIVFLFSCNKSTTIDQSDSLSGIHSWTSSQLSVLKQMWIGSLNDNADPSNNKSTNQEAAKLGQYLFFDTGLSLNKRTSCASCHQPQSYFSDNVKLAKGINQSKRNTPSIVGVAHNKWYFHDGRADSLWSQALMPLENANEHAGNRSLYAHYIYNSPKLRDRYERVFGVMPDISDLKEFLEHAGPVKDKQANRNWQNMSAEKKQVINQIFVNIGKSIAAYEQKLKPAASRVDNYIEAILNKDKINITKLLSDDEVNGMRVFTSKANCVLCHSGPMLTDSAFHNIATVDINNKPYDLGRYEGAKRVLESEFNCTSQFNDNKNDNCNELTYINLGMHETLSAFKTPGLRNVSKTAPYMHDGQFELLEDVINHYDKPDKLILGKKDLLVIELSDQEKQELVAFLKALDSKIDASLEWLSAPTDKN